MHQRQQHPRQVQPGQRAEVEADATEEGRKRWCGELVAVQQPEESAQQGVHQGQAAKAQKQHVKGAEAREHGCEDAERRAVVCRELTKRFEQVTRGTLAELAAAFDGKTPRGEIVVLVGRAGATEILPETVEAALRDAMKTMRMKDAATLVAGAMGLSRRHVYQTALTMEQNE